MKRFLSIVLCFIMVLSMGVSAFADDSHSHTITIKNNHDGYVYDAYQIFKGDLGADGVLSNVDWGTGVDGTALLAELKTIAAYEGCENAKDVAAILANNDPMNDPDAIAFAEIVAKHLTDTKKGSDPVGGDYVITGLGDGYYIVVNSTIPDGESTTYSRYILEVVRDVDVTHKGTYPTVDKVIVEAEVEVAENQAAIGENVNYKITGTIPANINDYKTYYYAFHDTLSKGLTYNNDMQIEINDVNVTKYFHIEASAYSATDGTTIYAGIQDILALENEKDSLGNLIGVGDINHGSKVVIKYSAVVNENAIVAGEGNPNKVYLEYSNDPNNEGDPSVTPPPPSPDKPVPTEPTGVTPEKEVETYTTEIVIKKVDGTGATLTGAEFTLSGEMVKKLVVTREVFEAAAAGETGEYYKLLNGTYTKDAPVYDDPATDGVDEDTSHAYVKDGEGNIKALYKLVEKIEVVDADPEKVSVSAFVDDNGYLVFTGLCEGTYTLSETVTPTGFNTIEDITFEIEWNKDEKKFHVDDNDWIMVEADNTLSAWIVNVAGTTLPATGGIGTTIFYILGGGLFIGALVFLVTKKRMSE